MAAFCGCCGAEITDRAEVCAVCGTPRHGMVRHDRLPGLDLGDPGAEQRPDGESVLDSRSCDRL
jgi:hypothetical protein